MRKNLLNMKKWRTELNQMMAEAGFRRPPALRRSGRDDFLFMTDYPIAADEMAVAQFVKAAAEEGWRVERDGDRLYLDRPAVFEAVGSLPDPVPEASCCLSLLKRHGNEAVPSDGSAERMLLKALDEGTDAYQKACRTLHVIWAALLRKGAALPKVDMRFFGGLIQ